MFTQNVTQHDLLTRFADNYFKRRIATSRHYSIDGVNDKTLLLTARAVLYDKISENDYVEVGIKNYTRNCETSADVDYVAKQHINNVLGNTPDGENPASFSIWFIGKDEIGIYDNYFKETDGWEEIEKIRLFYVKNFKTVAYANNDHRATIMVMEVPRSSETRIRFYHAAQCSILTALPWFFNPETDRDKLTEDDIGILQALGKGDYDEYVRILNDVAAKFDFVSEGVRSILDKFETQVDEGRLIRVRNEIRELNSNINAYIESIAQITRQLREKMQIESGIQMYIEEHADNHDFRDFFMNSKSLKCLPNTSDDGNIYFIATTYLNDWDEAIKDNVVNDRRSLLYRGLNENQMDDAAMLYKAIFTDGTIKIPMAGRYRISSSDQWTPFQGLRDDNGDIPNDVMPNPHINQFGCTGGYGEQVAYFIRQENWIALLEISIVSAGNINFSDGAVLGFWVPWMFNSKCNGRNCFELPDGTRVKIDEAIKWLKEQEVSDEQAD